MLDVNVAIGRHLERDDLFGALASCLRNRIETDRFGIELPIAGTFAHAASGSRTDPSQVFCRRPG